MKIPFNRSRIVKKSAAGFVGSYTKTRNFKKAAIQGLAAGAKEAYGQYVNTKGEVVVKRLSADDKWFGTKVTSSLVRATESGKDLTLMPLRGGIMTPPGNQSMSETKFYASLNTRPSKSLRQALSMIQRVEFKTNQNFSVNPALNSQAVSDLSIGISGSTYITPQVNYPYSWGICTGNINWVSGSSTVGSLGTMFNCFPGASNTKTSMYYLESVTSELALTNTSNYGAVVDIYECVAKRDFSGGNTSYFGSTNTMVLSPVTYWQSGMLQASGSVGGIASAGAGLLVSTTIGSVPTDSQLFNEYWQISSKFRLNLPGLSTHVHRSLYTYNKVLSYFRIQDSTLMQGITRNYIIVVKGTPVISGSSVVDYSANVAVTCNAVYKGASLSNSQKYTAYANTSGVS